MNEVIPIFKTDNSFGKSILTDKDPSKEQEGGARSVFSIAKENDLKSLVVIEDSLIGFYYCHQTAKKLGIKLIYGIYIKIKDPRNEKHDSKIIILSKNDIGHKSLMKFYSKVETELGGKASIKDLKKEFSGNAGENVSICVPFYDSFIHWNIMNLDGMFVDFGDLNVTFFRDSKGLPFDPIINEKMEEFCENNNYPIQDVHSIYYEKDENVKELQVYKILTTRSFGKPSNLGRPNLEGFGSNQFSWESYTRKINGKK